MHPTVIAPPQPLLVVAVVGLFFVLMPLGGCGDAVEELDAPPISRTKVDGLPRRTRVSEQISFGARPLSGVGFAKLASLGFDTVVCVESAEPDVDMAAGFGLKTYHVPMGFGAPSKEDALQVAAAAHSAEKRIYFYCHDGLARAPAAAVIAFKSLENPSLDGVMSALLDAGVGPSHAGLRQAAIQFTPLSEEAWKQVVGRIPSRVEPSGAATTMVEVFDRWSRLEEWAANDWSRPRSQGATLGGPPPSPGPYSELDAADQAAALSAAFGRLAEPDGSYARPVVFRRQRSEAQAAATLLEYGLRRGEPDRTASGYARLQASCTMCHSSYRK